MKTYRDLQVWQKSMTLVTETYKISKGFPKNAEQFDQEIEQRIGPIQVGTKAQRTKGTK